MHTILLIEDDGQIRHSLALSMQNEGYTVLQATCAAEGLAQVAAHSVAVIVLDLGLPDRDGKDVLKALRTLTQAPVIVLSARHTEQEKIAAFAAGANDYVTKPFSTAELLARIQVNIKTWQIQQAPSAPPPNVIQVRDLLIDKQQHKVTLRGQPIKLTPKEFALLWTLAQHHGQLVTHATLMQQVWGKAHTEDTHYLRIYIAQLRRKIEIDPVHDQFITNEMGVGYRLCL